MTQWLRQSTAGTVVLGPYVGTADGYTAGTAYSISQADILLSKNGGAFAQSNNTAGAAHLANGYYGVPLDTTDTNTLGRLRVATVEGSALPVWRDFMVVPSQVWDSFFGADRLQVHVDEMTNNIITAAVIATDAIDNDALAANAVTEIQSGLATAASIAALNNLSAAQVNAEVDTALADVGLTTTVTGRIDAAVSTRLASASYTAPDNASITAIKAKTDNLPADPADASDIAASFSSLASTLTTIAGYIDTEVAAIKAKTDNLPAAPAATGDIPSATTIADAVLSRSISNTEGSAGIYSLTALILAAFESSISGTTWTIKQTNGSSNFATRTVTTDASADPITGVS